MMSICNSHENSQQKYKIMYQLPTVREKNDRFQRCHPEKKLEIHIFCLQIKRKYPLCKIKNEFSIVWKKACLIRFPESDFHLIKGNTIEYFLWRVLIGTLPKRTPVPCYN